MMTHDADPQFSCPKCGTTEFKVPSRPKTIEDFIGAVCSNCGGTITEDDIKAQALKIAERKMRKAFGGNRTIKINI
jgi:ribosomal protein S27AE